MESRCHSHHPRVIHIWSTRRPFQEGREMDLDRYVEQIKSLQSLGHQYHPIINKHILRSIHSLITSMDILAAPSSILSESLHLRAMMLVHFLRGCTFFQSCNNLFLMAIEGLPRTVSATSNPVPSSSSATSINPSFLSTFGDG